MDAIEQAFKDTFRVWRAGTKDGKLDKKKPLDFYPGYLDSVREYEQIKPHTQSDCFPYALFEEKAPNELPAEHEYGKKIFRPITMPYWQRANNTLYKIWNPQNWSWRFTTEVSNDDENPEKYFTKDYPVFGSIEKYFRDVVTPLTVKDANALLCVMPSYVPELNERVEPIIRIFNSPDVWHFSEKLAICLSDEKSEVTYSGRKVKEGMVFFAWDEEMVYKFEQVGNKIDYKFERIDLYKHELGYLPCKRLGGVPIYEQGLKYWQSFFYPAIPILDQALINFNTLQKSVNAHAFLQRWEYVKQCDFMSPDGHQCDRGYLHREGGDTLCPACHGSGVKQFNSALSVYQVNVEELRLNDPDGKIHIPPAGYIDVDHSILDFLDKQVDKAIEKAFQVINIDVHDSDATGTETATGKAIDREEQHAFLIQFAANQFHLLEFSVNAMGKMRYPNEWADIDISEPTTFELRKPSELTKELETAPVHARRMLLAEFGQSRFGTDPEMMKRHDLVLKLDSLASVDEKDIAAGVASGIIPKYKAVIHRFAHELIDMAIEADAAFWDKDFAAQREQIKALAEAMLPVPVNNELQRVLGVGA